MAALDYAHARRCACGNIRRTTRALTQLYDGYLLKCGLRVTQFSLLLNISLQAGLTVGELADRLIMDQTTVSRNLETLKRFGYVELTREGRDGRKRVLAITAAGAAKLAEAMPLWEEAQGRIESGLGADRLRELLKLLAMVSELSK
jgi:DNA-binding MarR family transcriptional regulator